MVNAFTGALSAGLLFTAVIVGGTASVHAIEKQYTETVAIWIEDAERNLGRQFTEFERTLMVAVGVPPEATD